jgi:hypothetical protein
MPRAIYRHALADPSPDAGNRQGYHTAATTPRAARSARRLIRRLTDGGGEPPMRSRVLG